MTTSTDRETPTSGAMLPTPADVGSSMWLRGLRSLRGIEELGVLVALVVLSLVIGIAHPTFFQVQSMLGVAQSAAFVAIVSYGMVFLIAMTELDLSVGSIVGFCALADGELMNHGMWPWLALLVGPLVGMALEAINAAVANLFSIPVIIVSLGSLSAFAGASTVLTDAKALQGLPLGDSFFRIAGGKVAGIPTSVAVMIVLMVVLHVVFRRTPFGARVRAIGSNAPAALFSGIRIGRTRLLALLMTGALCGLAGTLALAYYHGADPTLGSGMELQVIAAAIIGGTAIAGGTGTVPGAFIGSLLTVVINNGLVYFAVSPNWSAVVTGTVVVLAVVASVVVRRRRLARQLAAAG